MRFLRHTIEYRKMIVQVSCVLIVAVFFWIFVISGRALADSGLVPGTVDYMKVEILNEMSSDLYQDTCDILTGKESDFLSAAIGPNGLGAAISLSIAWIGYVYFVVQVTASVLKDLIAGKKGDAALWGGIAVKVIGGALVLFSCGKIADMIRDGGAALVNETVRVLGEVDKTSLPAAQASTAAASAGWLSTLKSTLTGLWNNAKHAYAWLAMRDVWVFLLLTKIAIKGSSYVLFMEFVIRRAFLPLALCDSFSAGLRSPGVRYLKKLFGVYLKMVIYLLTIAATSKFLAQIITSGRADASLEYFGVLYDCIGIRVAGITIMNNATTYVNELIERWN